MSNLGPNPLLKRPKKLAGELGMSIGDKTCWCWVQRQNDKCLCTTPEKKLLKKQIKDDESYKPLPQKHSLICFDRELFGQMSLELEVPILELALDNNASTAIDIDDQCVVPLCRRASAYDVLEYTNGINTNIRDLQRSKFLHNNQDTYNCGDCKHSCSNVNNFKYHLQNHIEMTK